MKKKFISGLIFIFVTTSQLLSQISSMSGTIYSNTTLEPLPFTNVVISGTYLGTTSNVDGYFYLGSIEQDSIKLVVSYIGYETTYKTIHYTGDSHVVLSLALAPKTLGGREVLVEDSLVVVDDIELTSTYIDIGFPFSTIQERARMDDIPSDIKKVKFTTSKKLHKDADNTQYLVDGVPAYNTRHLFGVYESFNLDGLKYVKNHNVSQGPQPLKMAPKVTEIIFNEGNRTRLDGHGELGLIESNLTLSGPHPANGSWYISGRRADFDGLYSMMTKENLNSTGLYRSVPDYSFYDINSKFTIDISADTKASANLFLSYDKLIWNGSQNQHALSDWNTSYASIRFQHRVIPQLMARGLFAHTRYGADLVDANFIQNRDSSFSTELSLGLNTTLLSGELDYFTSKNGVIKGGATIERVLSKFTDYDSTELSFPSTGKILSHVNSEFSQNFKKNIDASMGINMTAVHDISKIYWDPYFRINWEPMNIYGLGLNISHHTSTMIQQSIRGQQTFPIYDIILPVDNSINAPAEWDFVFESWGINSEGYRGNISLGYKRITEYSILDSIWSSDLTTLNSMLISGFSGNAFNGDIELEHQLNDYSLSMHYRYNWSELTNGTLTINDIRERDHVLKINFMGPSPYIVSRFEISLALASGHTYLDNNQQCQNLGLYHRVDVMAYKDFNYSTINGTAKFGVSNLLNTSTPDFPTNVWVMGSQYDREFALLPFMPTVSFEFTF